MGLWLELKQKRKEMGLPIIGLAPMDGVTDISYREIQAKYGQPDVIFTEFIPVEGIVRLNQRLLRDFWYSSGQRPAIAQIYGNEPELFYAAAQLVCELGFDGVDINMGCPAKSVVHRGCGAALINTPDLAQEIIRATQKAVKDWARDGLKWEDWPVISSEKAERLYNEFLESSKELGMYQNLPIAAGERREIPVSVKTRVGFSEPVTESWITTLLETKPELITVHGRTLKQMYRGDASWAEIAKAAAVRDSAASSCLVFGSGDVKSGESAQQLYPGSGVDGFLIGRGSYGNPWVFSEIRAALADSDHTPPNHADKCQVMIEHAEIHEHYKSEAEFPQMRKNLAWYISGIHGAAKLRSELVRAQSAAEVRRILS